MNMENLVLILGLTMITIGGFFEAVGALGV